MYPWVHYTQRYHQNDLVYITDVQKSLDQQVDDINVLRTQMLGEYEQMLSVRAEVMASQSQEVEKLQEEMAQIQRQYETQMSDFQEKVQTQTGWCSNFVLSIHLPIISASDS